MKFKLRPVVKGVLKVHRAYGEAKSEAIEQSVTMLEARTKPYFFLLFFAATTLAWLALVLTPVGPVEVYEAFGLYPLPVISAISYFSFFLGSKLVFRPTRDEVEDDTSSFALFSACQRRELRSLVSIGLALFHTAVFFLYLISKDSKLVDSFAGTLHQ